MPVVNNVRVKFLNYMFKISDQFVICGIMESCTWNDGDNTVWNAVGLNMAHLNVTTILGAHNGLIQESLTV